MIEALAAVWAALNLLGRVLLVAAVVAGVESAARVDVIGLLLAVALGFGVTRIELCRRLGQQ